MSIISQLLINADTKIIGDKYAGVIAFPNSEIDTVDS